MKKKIIKKKIKKKVDTSILRTEKEKKLFNLISANLGNKKGTKTMEEMMIEAGYSLSTARQQSAILCKVKASKEYKGYIEKLIAHRDKVIDLMETNASTAKYGELTASLARIENIILLGQGKSTSNVNILTKEEEEDLDGLFEENA